jgi:hypothetical protein
MRIKADTRSRPGRYVDPRGHFFYGDTLTGTASKRVIRIIFV